MANGRKRWASGGLILESDETTIQPSQLSRHKAQKHEEGYRWCPRRARHVPDTRGCCRRIARIYLAWVLSSAVFRDVTHACCVTTRVTAGVGGSGLASWLGCQKTGKKRQTTPRSIIMQVFSWKSWKKKGYLGNSYLR